MDSAGKDATDDYEAVGHSEDAREIMNPFLVGKLKDVGSHETAAAAPQIITKPAPSQLKPAGPAKVTATLPMAQLELFIGIENFGLLGRKGTCGLMVMFRL